MSENNMLAQTTHDMKVITLASCGSVNVKSGILLCFTTKVIYDFELMTWACLLIKFYHILVIDVQL